MEKVLTIVIPTYNMEKYLDKCLNSLIIPEYMDEIEVLIVNDGSKDSSLDIARKYETQYPQTFVVVDKENGNYGSCVNRGLKEANGKYFKVLDADDTFMTNNFFEFVKFLKSVDVDLVMSDILIKDQEQGVRQVVEYNLPVGVTFSFEHFAKKMFHICGCMQLLIVRRKCVA